MPYGSITTRSFDPSPSTSATIGAASPDVAERLRAAFREVLIGGAGRGTPHLLESRAASLPDRERGARVAGDDNHPRSWRPLPLNGEDGSERQDQRRAPCTCSHDATLPAHIIDQNGSRLLALGLAAEPDKAARPPAGFEAGVRDPLCSSPPEERVHEPHRVRLGGHRRLSGDHAGPRPVLPPAVGPQHRGLLRLGPQGLVVAGRHVDGGDHVRRRHAARRDRPRLPAGNRRQLAVVELPALRDDDGVPLRAAVAPRGAAHRRRVRRDALRRPAGGVPPRLPRHLPRPADELRDPRLGHQGDDQHHRRHAGRDAAARAASAACSRRSARSGPATKAPRSRSASCS